MARKQSAQLELELPDEVEPRREAPLVTRRERTPRADWRQRARRILFWSGAAAAVAGAAVAVYRVDQLLATDPRFTLEDGLVVEGVSHASRARIEAVFARDRGRSIYLTPLEQRRRSLLEIDWVDDAGISRLWPNRLAVRISERKPVAFLVAPGGAPALIDAEGVILSLPAKAELALPALTGITRELPASVRRERIRQVLELLREANAHAGQISEVDAADGRNLKVTFLSQGRAFRLWLGDRNYRARLENFLKFYSDISRRLPGAGTFDLRLDDRITVPAEGNPPPAPAPAKKTRGGRRGGR
jgi:cell division protein FtsQ